MDVLPIFCDTCRKDMGVFILPEDVHGNTVKLMMDALAITAQCPHCSFIKGSGDKK